MTWLKTNKSTIFKAIMVFGLLAYFIILFMSDFSRNVPMSEIEKYMSKDSSVTKIKKRNATDLAHFFSISDDEVDGFLLYKSTSPMSVEEMLVIKAKNRADVNGILEKLKAHIVSQRGIFQGYGTTQMAELGQAKVGKKGNYIYLMCGPDSGSWYKDFMSLI